MKLATALALFPLVLGAVEVELDFTITSTPGKLSRADVKYEIGTNFNVPSTVKTYTTTVPYTGNLVMTAEIEASTGNMDSFEFTEGAIVTPDVAATLYPFVGSVEYTATLTTSGIIRRPRSDQVDELFGGAPNGTLHYTTFSEGSFTATNYITTAPNLFPVTVTRLLAETNPYLIGEDIIFPRAIEITQTDADPLNLSYTASLHSSIQLSPVPLSYIWVAYLYTQSNNQYFTHKYSETGNIYADASYDVPTEFGQWALDYDLDLTTGEESNAAGLPYALIYAFDLPTDAASLPLTFISTPEPTVELDLPSSGLGFTVDVEYSPDLTSGFSPLPDENFEDGTHSLDAGKTGTVTLSYPGGEQGYLRFRVEL